MSYLNPWGALRRERLNAAALSSELINARGDNHRLTVEAVTRGSALRQIVSSIDSINTPNGTLRKVRRIAEQAVGG